MSEEKEKRVIPQNDLRFIVGRILKQERLGRVPKMSQNRVGELVNEKYGTNWKKCYVYGIERGGKLSFDSVAKIADVLGIDWQEKFKENLI